MKKTLLFSFLCMFSMHIFSQNYPEIYKALPEPYNQNYDDKFGSSVAIDGNYAVVGVPGYMNSQGCAYVLYKNGSTWERIAMLTVSDGTERAYFGTSVSISGDNIVVGAYYNDYKGSAYVFTKPEGAWADMSQTATLTASDAASGDYFGYSVSISGDNIVVGAYDDDDNGSTSGSAYVYTKPTGAWADATQTAKLTASDGAASDYFGYSVSISGDNIVVGAYQDDDNGNSSGSAYVFTKASDAWADMTQTAKLTASDGADWDYFGCSVSISGDNIVVGASGDGGGSAYIFTKTEAAWADMIQTAILTGYSYQFGYSVSITNDHIVVGAYDTYTNGAKSASAYVFIKPSGAWVDMTSDQAARLTASDGVESDGFGYSVSISGDNIIVGAYKDDVNGTLSGSVYTYSKPTGDWINATQNQKLVATIYESTITSGFGTSVSVDGDYAVVGVQGYMKNKGCVYVLHYTGTIWEKEAMLTASDGVELDCFGSLVSISGDNIVVGAYYDDDNGISSGSAYVFTKPEGAWTDMTQTAKLTASDGVELDYFGYSVSISGDNIVVGAYQDDDNGYSSGSAYVFTKPSDAWADMTQTAKLTASDGAASDYFGLSVSISGDNIVVGAYQDDDNGDGSGSAYVFTKPSGVWTDMTQTAKLTASDGALGDYFGRSVNISGDHIVVGASGDNYDRGSAYVFTKPSGAWTDMTQTAKLTASDYAANDNFGFSVSISGDNIVVGAHRDDDNGNESGSAYVFTKPSDSWADTTQTAKLNASDGAVDDYFGRSVNISGEHIVVGSPNCDNESGAAYFYRINNAPGNIELSNNTIDEDVAIGTRVGIFTASDEDTDDTHTFALITGDGTNDTDNTSFTIDGVNLKTSVALDYETKSEYKIYLQTEDAGGLTFEKEFVIAVTDLNEAPSNIDLATNSIDENSTIGSVIGQLSTTDVDDGDSFTYALATVDGTNDADNTSFTIDGANLKTSVALDYETKSEYKIYLQTEDAGGLTFEKEFVIAITDLNEEPSNIDLTTNSIDENSTIGSVIGQLSTTDVDGGDSFTYALASGDGTNDADNASFTIDGANLKTSVALDFETKSEYKIYVQTEDAEGLTFEKAFVINVNDVTETGISTLEQNGISIYPNPTNGIMNLSFSDNKTYTVKIYDLLGNILFDRNNVVQSKMIDISEYADGVYIMSIQNGDKIITSKIIKN